MKLGDLQFLVERLRFQIGRFFRGKKKSILVAKIISSTVDHCKMFYLPVYGIVNNIVHCSAPFW